MVEEAPARVSGAVKFDIADTGWGQVIVEDRLETLGIGWCRCCIGDSAGDDLCRALVTPDEGDVTGELPEHLSAVSPKG